MNRLLGSWVLALALAATGCGSDETEAKATSGGSTGSGSGSSSTSTSGGGGSAGSGNPATEPSDQFIPKPTGACPDFAEGMITVSPDSKSRDVRIWMSDAAKTKDGPLVFYWHGTGGDPTEAVEGLGQNNIDAIKAEGGIVAAPVHDPAAGTFPWFLTTGGNNEADLRVADEVLACAIESLGVDLRRIHSLGFSAGGLNTTQMSWRRSGYLASVVTYSGGQVGTPEDQDPTNKYAAMIFHGGPSDNVVISFQQASVTWQNRLKMEGHFAFICNHGMGHAIPGDAVDSVHQFLVDHPFGTVPDPYAQGLPAGFPQYCAL